MAADPAAGTILKWNGTAITEIVSFTGPNPSVETVEATDLSDSSKEFVNVNVYNPGEVTIELNFDPDGTMENVMLTDFLAFTQRVFQIEWLNGTAATSAWSANAFIISFEPSGAVQDKLSASVGIKLSGTLTT